MKKNTIASIDFLGRLTFSCTVLFLSHSLVFNGVACTYVNVLPAEYNDLTSSAISWLSSLAGPRLCTCSVGFPRRRFPIVSVNGKGKKLALEAWQAYEDVTETFVILVCHPFEKRFLDSKFLMLFERLTVILYDKTSLLGSLNDARRELCQKSRPVEKFPLTENAPLQHARQTVYTKHESVLPVHCQRKWFLLCKNFVD